MGMCILCREECGTNEPEYDSICFHCLRSEKLDNKEEDGNISEQEDSRSEQQKKMKEDVGTILTPPPVYSVSIDSFKIKYNGIELLQSELKCRG